MRFRESQDTKYTFSYFSFYEIEDNCVCMVLGQPRCIIARDVLAQPAENKWKQLETIENK